MDEKELIKCRRDKVSRKYLGDEWMHRIDVLHDQGAHGLNDFSDHATNDFLINNLIEYDMLFEARHDFWLDLATIGALVIVIGIDENVFVDPTTLTIYLFLSELGSINFNRWILVAHD